MSNELVKKEENSLVVQAESMDSWGQSNMSSKDLILSKILPMQMMSQKVIDGKASFGELRDTVNNELFGNIQKPVKFIPFKMEKVFYESEIDEKGKKKYLKTTPITPDNESLPWEDVVEGKKISRDYTLNFYCVLADQVKAELADQGGGCLPYIISFRRTSLKAGKKVATQAYAANAAMGKPPAATVIDLIVNKKTNDLGTFAVLDAVSSRPSSKEELATAFFWFKAMKSLNVKVDDSDLTEENTGSADLHEPTEF